MCMTVHATLSFLASFSHIFIPHLFFGVPYCLGDAVKQKEKEIK